MKPFIKESCNAAWDLMTANAEGKFCNLCKKDVIDFTEKEDYEIKEYLNNNVNVCGKFSSEQIINTDLTFNLTKFAKSSLSSLEKFAIVSFLVFGLNLYSCNKPYALGKIKIEGNFKPKHLTSKLPLVIFESLQKRNVVVIDPKKSNNNDSINFIQLEYTEQFLLGDVSTPINCFEINTDLFDWPTMHKWTKTQWDHHNRKQLRIKQILSENPVSELLNNQNNISPN